MAESVQRIVCGRALNGQHPKTAAEIITWLEDTVAGWNAAPTPFVWDGNAERDACEPNDVDSVAQPLPSLITS